MKNFSQICIDDFVFNVKLMNSNGGYDRSGRVLRAYGVVVDEIADNLIRGIRSKRACSFALKALNAYVSRVIAEYRLPLYFDEKGDLGHAF